MCDIMSDSDKDLPYSSFEDHRKALRKSSDTFHSQLKGFPHSFQLENQETVMPEQLSKMRDSLRSALAVGYKTPVETARARNLLAYILFRLKCPIEALEETQEALKCDGEEHNIVSIANQAVFLWYGDYRTEADKLIEKLRFLEKEESDFSYLRLKAKAELAFSYTRFEFSFYPLAKRLFEEVIAEAKEPEVWLWKFGLTLTRRRMLNKFNIGPAETADHHDVLRMYLEIADKCRSDSLKAKVFAEVGLVLYVPSCRDLQHALRKEANMSVLQACEKALALDDKDSSVLWKCAKLYRYMKDTKGPRDYEQRRNTNFTSLTVRKPQKYMAKALELLEKAAAIRPRSKTFHQLGLMYKKLATREKHSRSASLASSPDDRQQASRPHFGLFMDELSDCVSRKLQLSADVSQSDDAKKYSEVAGRLTPPISASKPAEDIYEMRKMVKSPLTNATTFCRGDSYIAETMDALTEAAKISHWENARAVYDLALMHKSLGELEHAKEFLEKLLYKKHCLGDNLQISVCEQLGLILKDLAERQPDVRERKRLSENGDSLLLKALDIASQSFSKCPPVNDHIETIWNFLPILFKIVDSNDQSLSDKLGSKAKLLLDLSKHEPSLGLLREMETIDPLKRNDPGFLKLYVENYVGQQEYEKALAVVSALQITTQKTVLMELFEVDYLHKVRFLAARRALERSNPIHKDHFRSVFREITKAYQDTDTAEYTWDVMILLDDQSQQYTDLTGIISQLEDAFGLLVTCNSNDVLPGHIELDGMLSIMERSRLIVVIAEDQKISRWFQSFISHAAIRKSSVTLLVNGGQVPLILETHRWKVCSVDLFQSHTFVDCEQTDVQRSSAALCELFSFLVNVDFD